MSTAEQATGVRLEIHIAASTEATWRALTDGIGEWWPAEFYIGGEAGKRSYHLEAKPGGRMYEEWEDGGGLLWGQVFTVIPQKMLQVVGHTFPQWGGPTLLFGTWSLEETEAGTTLRFEDDTLGVSSDADTAEKQKGWVYLMGTLKAHIEGTTPPVWEG